MKNKLYAIINKENIVVDAWVAFTLKEAQADNPDKLVIEVTEENSPWVKGEKYKPGVVIDEEQGN